MRKIKYFFNENYVVVLLNSSNMIQFFLKKRDAIGRREEI